MIINSTTGNQLLAYPQYD